MCHPIGPAPIMLHYWLDLVGSVGKEVVLFDEVGVL